MFTYIDPKVRQRLLERGKLVTINAEGEVIDDGVDSIKATQSISILGPIPLPITNAIKNEISAPGCDHTRIQLGCSSTRL